VERESLGSLQDTSSSLGIYTESIKFSGRMDEGERKMGGENWIEEIE
jgi:hypothetical protein